MTMIRTTILILCLGFGLSASSIAQDSGKKKGDEPGKKRAIPERLKQFDKNNDGKLDEAERKAMREEIAKKGEGKKKGKRGGADAGKRRAELLKKYDKDGDGKLNEAERKAMREDVTKKRGDGGKGKRRGDKRKPPVGKKKGTKGGGDR